MEDFMQPSLASLEAQQMLTSAKSQFIFDNINKS